MTTEVLQAVNAGMEALGLNYAFMQRNGSKEYPYWVGEYQESPASREDGLIECDFIITGYTRGSWLDLETAKEEIRQYFHPIDGKTVIAGDGSAVAIFYANSFPVPTGEAELKKIEIHLNVKEWKVN